MRVSSQLRRAGVLVASGLLGVGVVAVQPGAAQAATGPTVRVHITRDHVVQMAQGLRPGVHKFRVTSARAASFQLLRPHPGYTKAQAAKDVNAGLQGEPSDLTALRRFERNVTLLGGVSSRPHHPGVAYVRLAKGRLWAVDTSPAVTEASKILGVGVHGRSVGGNIAAPTRLRAIRETTWAPRPRSIPRSGTLKFANDSADNHFVVLAELQRGKTVADFRRWVHAVVSGGGDPGPPPLKETGGLDSATVSPGHAFTFRYHLSPGRYVLACFWPDADMGGLPHAFMGMFRGIRVR